MVKTDIDNNFDKAQQNLMLSDYEMVEELNKL